MKCPNCKTDHEYEKSSDVQCTCGAILRYAVPQFTVNKEGWCWRVMNQKELNRKALECLKKKSQEE